MITRIIALLIKEIRAVWYDKKSRMSLIIPPILQLVIFTWCATLDIKNVPIAILNRDNGAQSIELVNRFIGSPYFNKIIFLESVSQIAPFIDRQNGPFVLQIDDQFSRRLKAGKSADIQIILDGRKSNGTQILLGYAASIVAQYNNDFAKEAQIAQQPIQVAPRTWFNPNLLYFWYNIPSLCGVLSMIVGLVLTSLSVAREKELGTFDQLLVSPLIPVEILIGKALPAIIFGMAEASIILFVGVFIFGVPFTGHLGAFYFAMLVFVTSIVGVGLFISSLCMTQQQATLGNFIFIAPAITLSGFATPIENMPTWLQYITYIDPARYFLLITKGSFLKGLPVHLVLENTWQMAIIACFTLTAASWLFRRKLE